MSNLKINLEPRSIATCPNPNLPPDLAQAFRNQTLQHQVDVYKAAETNDIILDLAPTGTGKTKAGLSVLHHNRDQNAVYIAPTNALIEQQTKAAKQFIRDTGLPHIVEAASAKDIKSWSDDLVGKRSGEKLYNVLREPATIFPECGGSKPILLITNPDIFYYATFFAYNRLDRGNIASEFYNSFSTVIFDEFHLYDAKQLVSLFFYLALSKEFGYFQYKRKVVLLTATPEPACEAALKTIEHSGVRIARIDGESRTDHLIPSQAAVSLEVRKRLDKNELISEIANEVIQRLQTYPKQYGAVILDSLDQINRLNERLCDAGLEQLRGRITGVIEGEDRQKSAQRQVILATSTVDVGFNFEREVEPERQNLDWLIFSTRDRFSFWQRLGRVGRVLGKKQTDIPSEAIAYLPEQAWEQGIENLDCSGGREALKHMLESLDCMKRPFLDIYWRSEAFLEIARPLLELESSLHNLDNEHLVHDLYQSLQNLLEGSRTWKYYKCRMMLIVVAETIEKAPLKPKRKEQWSFVKTLFKQSPFARREFIKKFLECNHSDLLDQLKRQEFTIEELEKDFREDEESAAKLKEFASFWKTVWSPLFRFRDSLFENLTIYDPHNLLLDEVGETNLDPIHLLRFYEFESNGNHIEVTSRSEEPYQLFFSLQVSDIDVFNNTLLSKLYAFKGCQIKRMQGESIRPTQIPESLKRELNEKLIPGVIVSEKVNPWVLVKLKKQGLECYPMKVDDCFQSKNYLFFPSLSGILAIASAGVALKCPDDEEFWVI